MEKIPSEIKNKFRTAYADKSVFAANARLLQSIWREERNIPSLRTWGNYLSLDNAYCKQSNFLTEKIRAEVKKEVDDNELAEGEKVKVLKTDRLYENLLASQPLAFNLFAELKTPHGLELANTVFKNLFTDVIKNITGIEFEISPGRSDLKYTGDRSAFDVFIEYDGYKGKGFIGVEIKYAESLLDKPASFRERYKEVSSKSGKFTPEGIEELSKMPMSLEQIWRDHLLSLSMLPPVNNNYDEGFFVYLFPKENTNCTDALAKYQHCLIPKEQKDSGLHILHMEELINELKKHSDAQWILDFEDRYLNFGKIDKIVKECHEKGN